MSRYYNHHTDMDERFIYIPTQSPTPSSPDDVDEEQCLFDDMPLLAYGKEEEVRDTASQIDATTQASTCHWPPDIKSEETVVPDVKADEEYYTSGEKKLSRPPAREFYYFLSQNTDEASPSSRRRTNSSKKNRTPRTALKMMERHRENERTRHHNLNDSLGEICKDVPGSSHDGRETKVVMMQRIISYVAYLENTIVQLCSELGIPYSSSMTSLTLQLRNEMESRTVQIEKGNKKSSSRNERDSMKKTPMNDKQSFGRRLKLSSPTVDSTSDHQVPQHIPKARESKDCSQDSTVPTSSFLPFLNDNAVAPWFINTEQDGEVVNACEYDPFFSQEVEANDCLRFSSSLMEPRSPQLPARNSNHVVPTSLSLLSSPDQREGNKENKTTFNLGGNIMNIGQVDWYGSERDASFDPDLPLSQAVSPDNVLQTIQIPSSSSAFLSPMQSSLASKLAPLTPGSRKNKRKQYTPKRSPFNNLDINSADTGNQQYFNIEDDERFQMEPINYEVEATGNEEPEDVSLQSLGLTRSQKTQIAQLQSQRYRPASSNSSEGSRDLTKSGKTDLRKTSWMNGFMMFSRLNRRTFINANPGVHTSHISKIMGHAWRNMTPEEQAPYKEKARLCAQELQKQQMLPADFTTPPSLAATPTNFTTTATISSTQDKCGFFNSDNSSGSYVSLHLDDC
ncbi:uncharacterized protein LOC124267246 [Haliotis rubra]|uniref:uncharacterized protein LOC124267246 n=1 Tax=Haliotis rubra TaxID=36100 RepID=UPI001EE526D3|nr:uncharacterized protein LOC124267246 [Haliotis rubra]